jgi:nuclear pore complex protein Nup98-Nup96
MSKWGKSSQASKRNAPIYFSRSDDGDSSNKTDTERLTTSSTGFGANTSTTGSLFGNKPASNPFGTTTSNTGGGLFGSSTTNTGGFGATGGFGSTTSNNAFGGNTGGSGFSFGAAKPAFGATANSTPMFGQGGAGTTGGFGASSSPFGAAGSGTALSNQSVPPSEGTASTPYAPTLEKEAAGVSSNYQSINFMPPYQKYSFEELRLADYNAGRRYGNNTGQAGGFGTNSFGGFGASNTGGFGGNTSSNPFGAAATSSSGFGANTSTTGFGGGGLFGSKPATGGLFTQQSSAAPSGGLFGTSNNTSTNAFGGANSTGFGTSGGLFGNNNNQNQQKPSLFGTNTGNTGSSFSFGNNSTSNTGTGGGLFGTNTNTSYTSAFGGNQQQSGGLFGANNTQQKPSLFGTNSGSFGTSTNQNQASGGLFGGNTNTTTGGGLFGNNANTNTSTGGGLFGSNPSTNTGGGLFGSTPNNQQKPGGLFGGSTFGNNNTSGTGTGLFGGNNNQQQSGGLFSTTNNNTGSGFSFGNNANKPGTGSLFGTGSNQQSGGFGGSLFAPGQSTQQNQQQSEFKTSSLNDPNPYGQTSIWTGLPVPTPDNSKPLFTPLSATQKMKESQSKPPPSLRLNQSRYMTPPRRSGFGFSYSTYGTPNSAASTPGGSGLSGSMYGSRSFNGGSFGRSFGKSASVSNLRSHFSSDGTGVLSPDAFAATNTRWSGGNMRRLTIDRSIRNDLFSRPSLPAFPTNGLDKSTNGNAAPAPASIESSGQEPVGKLKKRVSFDKDTAGGQNGASNGEAGALVAVADDEDEYERSRITNGSATPEAEPVRGNELAVVPEDRESDDVSSRKVPVQAKPDPQPGDYWMKPTRAELSKLPREKLSRFVGFEVGRKGCGKVVFNGPVDLTSIPLDDLYEKIVEIRLRSVTVYPDASSKPPVGKGLNVPSTISIENSWPRARGQPSSATSGPIFDKHVNRLKKMNGTEFVSYDVATGVWTFRVPHYTRYGLDYDEDDELGQSQLSAPPDSLTSSRSADDSGMDVDSEEHEDYEDEGDDGDDTFAFKQKTLPGGYGRQSAIEYEDDVPSAQEVEDGPSDSEMEEDDYEEENQDELSMVGAYPPPAASPAKPILKASTMGTPGKALINIDGDWAEQLQRTISPRKQNRDALREVQSKVLLDRAYEPMKPSATKAANKKDFRTSIDIMHSLFSRHEERMADLKGRKGKAQTEPDFEV